MKKQDTQALEMIKAVYDDSEAVINNRKYTLTKTNHHKRLQVFAFFTKHNKDIVAGDFSFFDTPKFSEIETIINNIVTFDGSLLSRLPNHWETYPEDYIVFITTVLGAISYPFFRGVVGS